MKKFNTLIAVCMSILTLSLIVYVLSIGAFIIIPFIVASLLSFIILSITGFFYKRFFLPKFVSFLLALFSIGLVFYIIGKIINTNIDAIIRLTPTYQDKLIRILDTYASMYNIEIGALRDQLFSFISLSTIVTSFAGIIGSIVTSAGIIFFFTLFILLESKSFMKKMALITGGEDSTFFQAFDQIKSDIKSYFLIKTLVSLVTGFLSGIILFFYGLDFFVFWAFIIFILNYIPNVGSIIAVFFPVVFSLVQFESLSLTLSLLIVLTGIQILMGNFMEPKLMGNKLNLSPLVILISLIFWATLWGPIGMLLCVPIMAIINITLAHIPATRPIAVLLSEKGIIKFSGMHKSSEGRFSLKKMKKFFQS